MPRKGMASLFFHSSPSRSAAAAAAAAPKMSRRQSFQTTLMEDNIARAEPIITRWDPASAAQDSDDSVSTLTSLFHDRRDESRRFLRAVSDLHSSMHFFSSSAPVAPSSSTALVRSHRLMQAAMRRLQKELHHLLSANRHRLDADSLSSNRSSLSLSTSAASLSDCESDVDPLSVSTCPATTAHNSSGSSGSSNPLPTSVLGDIRAIAGAMVASGYAKECVQIFTEVRRSSLDESLFRLGFDRSTTLTQFHKLDWAAVELRLKNWLAGARTAVTRLFSGERFLCDSVFGSSDTVKETCFAAIARDAAVQFLALPEIAASTKKYKSPPPAERIFLFLDLYNSVADLWPEIDSVFSYESTLTVRSQASTTITKLAESIRAMVAEFETSVQKDSSKAIVPGGGLHPLTRYAMNYLAFLADYGDSLAEIFAGQQQQPLPSTTRVPDSMLNFVTSAPPSPAPSLSAADESRATSPLAARFGWLLLVLLCKLDVKAELYKNMALSYLFLANNLQFIVAKVRSSNLRHILGQGWVAKHEQKARSFSRSYEKLGWNKVVEAIPEDPSGVALAEVRERMKKFNRAFEEAYKVQKGWVVVDGRLREEIKVAVARKVVLPYRGFYEVCQSAGESGGGGVRFAPEDLENYLSELFFSSGGGFSDGGMSVASSGYSSGQSFGSGSSGSSKLSRWRFR